MPLFRRRARRPPPAPEPDATQPLQRPLPTEEAVYEETVPVEGPPPRIWPWLVVLLVLVAAGLGALYFLTRDDGGDQAGAAAPVANRVDVPDVVGERADRAAARLVDVGLKAEFQRRLSKQPSGIVLEQDPGGATSVARGSTVLLTISRGTDTVAVPALTGLQLEQALQKLQAAKLKGATRRVSSAKPAGQVIAQAPGGGHELKPGAAVVLTVSKGKQSVAVPDVIGLSRAEASAELERAGFEVAVAEVPAAEPKGTVVAQSPGAGERAPKDSKVQINVSKGTGTTGTVTITTTGTTQTTTTPAGGSVAVPDVVGLKQAAARRQLEDASFKVDARQVPSKEPVGTVVAQFPAAGQLAKRGGTIRINVSKGDGRKAVPDVIGDDEATARQRLEQAGFTVTVVDQDTTDPAEDGVVVDQDPAGAARRKPGADVTIFVGVLTG
jgi:beta-lactam-binding protein with PASTA domain